MGARGWVKERTHREAQIIDNALVLGLGGGVTDAHIIMLYNLNTHYIYYFICISNVIFLKIKKENRKIMKLYDSFQI